MKEYKVKAGVMLSLFLSALAVGCGEDYEPSPAVVIVDDEDMPGGVDSGVVSGGPGGMMGEEVDPVFKEWVETRAALGQYDCSCSQGDGWRAIWDQQTCVNHWTRLIGGEETLGCQYNELVRTESAKARFYPYAQCHINNDRRLLSCLGTEQCQSDGDTITECLYDWGRGRRDCGQSYGDVESIVSNTCRVAKDFPLIDALSLVNIMGFALNLSSDIIHPFGLDNDFVNIEGYCGVSCNNLTISFDNNGYYRFYAYVGYNGSYDEYYGDGFYGLDEVGRIYFTQDCKEKVSMNVVFAFQRAWFKGLGLRQTSPIGEFGQNYINEPRPEIVCE